LTDIGKQKEIIREIEAIMTLERNNEKKENLEKLKILAFQLGENIYRMKPKAGE